MGLGVEPDPLVDLAHHGRTHHAVPGYPPAARISDWHACSRGTKSRSTSRTSKCDGSCSDLFHRRFCRPARSPSTRISTFLSHDRRRANLQAARPGRTLDRSPSLARPGVRAPCGCRLRLLFAHELQRSRTFLWPVFDWSAGSCFLPGACNHRCLRRLFILSHECSRMVDCGHCHGSPHSLGVVHRQER